MRIPFGEAERLRRARATLVRAELVTGVITLPEALRDPAIGGMAVGKVVAWLPGYGPARTETLLQTRCWPPINPTRRCRELTDRQRLLLGERARAPR